MMRKLIHSCVMALAMVCAAGCQSEPITPKGPPDPATYEELTARQYWLYKSNVDGKAINEWRSPDGLWQCGQYVSKKGSADWGDKEQDIDIAITTRFKARTSDIEAIGGTRSPPVEASVQTLTEDRRITVDKGEADGLRAGCYATVMLKQSDIQRSALRNVIVRYYYENIYDVAGVFEVVEIGEHAATLKPVAFRAGRAWRDIEAGAPVTFGFAPKWKHEILHMLPYAVDELPGIADIPGRPAAVAKLTAVLVDKYDGDKATINEMIALLDDASPVTLEIINGALAGITGMDFGYSAENDAAANKGAVEAWRAWWEKERSSFDWIASKKEKKPESE